MKASDLRIGNIVAVCYEECLIPGEVVVLEPDVVHLANRRHPDSDRDIVGVPLEEHWLKQFNFIYNRALERWERKNIFIKNMCDGSTNYWIWQSKAGILKFSFVHELQDLLHTLGPVN
jgi:hypothetical protein